MKKDPEHHNPTLGSNYGTPLTLREIKKTLHADELTHVEFDEGGFEDYLVIAVVNDVKILSSGEFYYADYPVSTDSTGFVSESGGYTVHRRRERVTRKFALQKLLLAVVPDDLLDLLPSDIIGADNNLAEEESGPKKLPQGVCLGVPRGQN